MLVSCLTRARHWHSAVLCSSRAAWYSIQVTVPPLGDSISEGSIAAVLKQPGDSVLENEPIAQIETDKVTIDIKSPTDGTLVGILVQKDDVVVPGQLVATVHDTTGQAHALGAVAPAPPPPPPAAAAAPPPAPAGRAHTPSIRFPARRTADGRQLSAMSEEEAAAYLRSVSGAAAASHAPSSTAPPAAAAAAAATAPAAASSGAAPAAAAATAPSLPGAPPAPPLRRTLTDQEVETIMLGGAAP